MKDNDEFRLMDTHALCTIISSWRKIRGGVFGVNRDRLKSLKDFCRQVSVRQSALKDREAQAAIYIRKGNECADFLSGLFDAATDEDSDHIAYVTALVGLSIERQKTTIAKMHDAIKSDAETAAICHEPLSRAIEAADRAEQIAAEIKQTPGDRCTRLLRNLRVALVDIHAYCERVKKIPSPDFDLAEIKVQSKNCRTLAATLRNRPKVEKIFI